MIISKNEKRNMMMVAHPNGTTVHVPIDENNTIKPKTGPHNPKGGKKDKKFERSEKRQEKE